MEDAARDVALGEDRRLVGDLDSRKVLDELEVRGPARLGHALELALDEERDEGLVGAELVLPPSDRQVAPERLLVVEVGPDNRGLEVDRLPSRCRAARTHEGAPSERGAVPL